MFCGEICFMFLIKMIGFCKSPDCPPSEVLLDLQNGKLRAESAREIYGHLDLCDFCDAEVDLYSHYPEGDEPISLSEIPRPLFELAESLLNNRHKDTSLLNKLLIEDRGLTLKEV